MKRKPFYRTPLFGLIVAVGFSLTLLLGENMDILEIRLT
jgi:hypothetical protein